MLASVLVIGLANLVRGHLQTEACTLNVTVTLLQDPPPPPPLNVMNEYSSVLY